MQDNDGLFYVDYFIELPMIEGKNRKTNYEHMKTNIIALIKQYGKYKRPGASKEIDAATERVISKYAWVISKFNEQCKKDSLPQIQYDYRLNEIILKPEIVVL